MGRKRIDHDKQKLNTKIRIRRDLKELAQKKGLNLSQIMEEALKKILDVKD